MKINHLIISGGGTKGISYIGALMFIANKIDCTLIDSFSGSSAGSMICLFLNIGYTLKELRDIFFLLDFTIYSDMKIDNMFNIYGFDDGNKFINLIKSIIINKGHDPNITFKRLYEITSKELYITGTNITTEKPEYFSHISTPDMKIIEAIRVSISIPLFYSPVNINNNLYIDGAVLSPYPNKCVKNKTGNKLGLILDNRNKNNNEINSIDSYLSKILNTCYNYCLFKLINKQKKEIIIIKIKDNVNAYNFCIDFNVKKKLYISGINSSIKYYNKYFKNVVDIKYYFNIWLNI